MLQAMVPFPTLPAPDAVALVAIPLLLAAAYRDIAVRRIPNAVVGALVAIGLARHAMAGVGAIVLAAVVASFVFVAVFMLWHRGVLGGGDAKLLAAVALLVPPAEVPHFLLATAVAGGILASTQLLLRARCVPVGPAPDQAVSRILRCEAWRICRGAPLPYGVAIAAGALFVLLRPGV